jgi:hypothetical protein
MQYEAIGFHLLSNFRKLEQNSLESHFCLSVRVVNSTANKHMSC